MPWPLPELWLVPGPSPPPALLPAQALSPPRELWALAWLGPGRRRHRVAEPAALLVEVGVLGGDEAAGIGCCLCGGRGLVRNAEDLARAQAVHVVRHKRFLIRAEQRDKHLLESDALNSVPDGDLREIGRASCRERV